MSFTLGPIEAGLSALWEHKASVPEFHWTDLVQQQLDTTAGNLGVLPKAEQLGAGVNDFMRGERAKTLTGIPGLADIEGQTTANLKNWLAGNLSPDLVSQISRGSNARAFAGGYGQPGGGMKRNLEARDLGLGSLQLAQSAMPLASQYMNQEFAMRRTPEFDPTQMFINPMQAAQFNAAQRGQQWNRDWLANRIAAQPQPWQQSIMNSIAEGGAMGDSMLSTMGGGMLGGMGKTQAPKSNEPDWLNFDL